MLGRNPLKGWMCPMDWLDNQMNMPGNRQIDLQQQQQHRLARTACAGRRGRGWRQWVHRQWVQRLFKCPAFDIAACHILFRSSGVLVVRQFGFCMFWKFQHLWVRPTSKKNTRAPCACACLCLRCGKRAGSWGVTRGQTRTLTWTRTQAEPQTQAQVQAQALARAHTHAHTY